jgi:hypothetical protein
MPLDLGSVNGINAVWFVPADAPWRERMSALLADLRVEEAAANLVLEFLDHRVRGEIDWRVQLEGAVLPNGRPAPPVRLYNDRLRGGRTDTAADALPMVALGPLIVAFEFWGEGEQAGEPGTLGFEVVTHRQVVHPWQAGTELWDGTVVDVRKPEHFAKLAFYGDAFAHVMARGCEVLRPVFALSDGMQPVSDQLARATSDRVRQPAPPDTRLADFAWALMYWAPERMDEKLRERLDRLSLPDPTLAASFPSGVEATVRTLDGGGRFLQVRHVLGSETRDARKGVETPLAMQLGLRSNHLLYKT